jgi:hypothetical protein
MRHVQEPGLCLAPQIRLMQCWVDIKQVNPANHPSLTLVILYVTWLLRLIRLPPR